MPQQPQQPLKLGPTRAAENRSCTRRLWLIIAGRTVLRHFQVLILEDALRRKLNSSRMFSVGVTVIFL